MAISGVLSVAQGIVVIGGGLLDLSLPVSLVVSAWATVTLLGAGIPDLIAVLCGIAAGGAWGLLNGLIIVLRQAQPDHRDPRHRLRRPSRS